eukprot:364487-Chlamydomonas_euryale.AAC.36
MDGSIVKVAALAGQPSKLGLATRGLTTLPSAAAGAGTKRQADAMTDGARDTSGSAEGGAEAKRPRADDAIG